MANLWQSFSDGLLGLLFPDRCAGCGRSGALLCQACRAGLRPYAHNGRGVLVSAAGQPVPLDEAAIAFVFEGALREAVHALKYDRRRRMGEPLGDLLAQHLRCHPLPADGLIAVPLHPRRLAERGFNQSDLLAQRLSLQCHIPFVASGLIRNRDTAHQVGLDAQERQANVSDAFTWQHHAPPPARVLLIDDVLTTGATLGACAQALRAAGSHEVRALVLARSQ